MRRPKSGNQRIDAALDALGSMGFPKNVVKKALNNLLKVYSGQWFFIEQDSYRVLIEELLQSQEETAKEENELPRICDVGSSSVLKEVCSPHNNDNQNVEIALPTNNNQDAQENFHATVVPRLPAPKDVQHVQASFFTKNDNDSKKSFNADVAPIARAPASLLLECERRLLHQRRKPCFGYISESDDEPESSTSLCARCSKSRPDVRNPRKESR